jgi:phosphinothricin acetyltransferase
MEQRILKTLERLPWLSCAVGSDVLGYAYANPHRVRASYQWSVEVSVYVHEHHRQKGIARALYTSLFTILRLQGFYNAYAGITLPNTGGVHLHESFGFEPVGIYKSVAYKLNKWHDVGWWQLQLHEHPVVPQPPARFDSVRESHGWAAALAAGEPLLKL